MSGASAAGGAGGRGGGRAEGRAGVLWEEHLLLGAAFGEPAATDAAPVDSYPLEGELADLLAGAVLADLTGTAYLLVSGGSAPGLFRAAAAGRELAVGEAAFEAVLTGEGRLLSAPLALRSGDHEFVLVDPTARGAALAAWLGFLAGAERDGVAPFSDAAVEDASGMLVPLLLAGARSEAVLADYLRTAGERLPAEGAVAALYLDAIPALVARVPDASVPTWLVLVPAARARAVWRSLLSFTELTPVGTPAAATLFSDGRPWAGALGSGEGPAEVSGAELASWGLVRDADDFVGARSLRP